MLEINEMKFPLDRKYYTKDGSHLWLKQETGYYDAILTPTGIIKQSKSINFNAMKQPEFNDFYKKAGSVVWEYIFKDRNFESPEQADNLARQMAGII